MEDMFKIDKSVSLADLENLAQTVVDRFKGSFDHKTACELNSRFLKTFLEENGYDELIVNDCKDAIDQLGIALYETKDVSTVFQQFVDKFAREVIYGRWLEPEGYIVAGRLAFKYPDENGVIVVSGKTPDKDFGFDLIKYSDLYYRDFRLMFPDDEVYFRPKNSNSSDVYYYHLNCPEEFDVLRRNDVENKVFLDRNGFMPWIKYEKFAS